MGRSDKLIETLLRWGRQSEQKSAANDTARGWQSIRINEDEQSENE
jgi:hypothetical protein